MHTEQQIQDIGILNKGLQLLNIDVALQPVGRLRYAVPCRFINNPGGGLRWLWPEAAREPQFLRFYYQGSTRGKWFARAIRAGFALRLPGLVSSGKMLIYTSAIGLRQLRLLDDWAIFTGTTGINRKLVIWHQDKAGCSAFTKLSLSIPAARNIYSERNAIQQSAPEGVVVPQTIHSRCLAFTQQDLFGGNDSVPLRDIADIPVAAMQRWLGCDVRLQALGEASWFRQAQAWLQAPKRGKDDRISEVLLQKMRMLMDCMLPQAKVPVARSHGDFTPWNARRRGEELLLIDWELSREDMPALYDLFHFIYQNGILVKRKPFAAIRREIDETLRRPEWEAFLLAHDIDAGEAEQQYLLATISYYLQAYSRQAKWHYQVPWLMQVWCEALGFWMDYEGLLTQRQLVLQDIAHFMHDRPYAAMKFGLDDITALPAASDLDLCMPRAAAAELAGYLKTHRCVDRIREKQQSFMRQLSIFLSGGGIIHIDCISEMRRRSVVFASARQTWEGANLNETGIKLPRITDDLRYTRLFYLLNGATVPHHYRDFYLSRPAAVQAELISQLHAEGAPAHKDFASALQYDDAHRHNARAFLKAQPVNRGWQALRRKASYAADKLRHIIPQRGFIITFSGVDGAGKSTVIEATRQRIDKELRLPVVVLRHRPSLLPILSAVKYGRKGAEQQAAIRLPRQGQNRSVLGSYLRFAYYYSDYLVGQCYVHLRYVMRGYAVLYDRYYFDFINDSKRSNIILPAAFTAWWYRFLFKPDLNFFLYAPTEVILQRKQELSAESIEQLTGQYLALFNQLERRSGQGHYISVPNLRLGDTLDTLFQHIKTQEAKTAA